MSELGAWERPVGQGVGCEGKHLPEPTGPGQPLRVHCSAVPILPQNLHLSPLPSALPHSWPRPSTGVLSEEQIRLKKLKRQEEEQAQAAAMPPRASSPPQVLPQLSPEQLGMIEKLVAAQQQCNRRSFSDQLRVTVPGWAWGEVAIP